MAKVTFHKNVDHYRHFDVKELDDKEIERLDAYVARWKIKDAFTVEGRKAKKVSGSAKVDSDKTAATAKASQGDAAKKSTTTIKKETATTPEGEGGEQAAMTVGPTSEGDSAGNDQSDGDSNPSNDGDVDTNAQESTSDAKSDEGTTTKDVDATDEASELPPVDDEPATDEGSKPKVETKGNDKK